MSEQKEPPAYLPNALRAAMTFIDRVGFPILAFLMMFWLLVRTLDAINRVTDSLRRMDRPAHTQVQNPPEP